MATGQGPRTEPGLDAARRATVRVCDGAGEHRGQGLLLTLDGEGPVVLTCHHVVAPLGPGDVFVQVPGDDGTLGPRIPASYDAARSRPGRDAVVLRLDADDVPDRPNPLLHVPDPATFTGPLDALGLTHMEPQVFVAQVVASTRLEVVPPVPGGWPDPPARYLVPVIFTLAGTADARGGISGGVVLCAGGVLGLTHFARDEGPLHGREAYAVPLSVWADGWPALAALIRPLALAAPGDGPESILAAAHARLAALPTEVVPGPAPLPPGSHLPLPHNPLFVGRDEELRALATVLKAGEAVAVGAVTGIGGMGKTQLASEFAHRYGRYFAGGVFWVSFAAPPMVESAIAACGDLGTEGLRAAGMPAALDWEWPDVPRRATLVRQGWAGPLPRLLIFDNLEDPALLREWRPTAGGSRVLVTSRRAVWSATLGVRAISLDPLGQEEGVVFLRRYLADASDAYATDPDLAAIAAELGGLPLALHLAGSYLARYWRSVTPAAYLADLRRVGPLDHRSLQGLPEDDDSSPTVHVQHVAQTFALSYGALDPVVRVDARARTLLLCAAHLAPGEPIPRDLLAAPVVPEDNDTDVLAVEDALRRLTDLGLLEPTQDDGLRLHRLLGYFARREANAREMESAREAVQATVLARGNEAESASYMGGLRPLAAHLGVVADAAEMRGDREAPALCNALGTFLLSEGNYGRARTYLERALAIREATLPPGHPDLAESLNNLGLTLREQGDYVGARDCLEQALAIAEALQPSDLAAVATTLNNLGITLRSQGDYAGARAYLERALDVTPPDHPNLARTHTNLGTLLWSQGDYAGARAYHERALAILEAKLLSGHPHLALNLALSQNNLGMALLGEGDYAGARVCFERAIAISEAALSPGHPTLATHLNNLGGLLSDQGDYAGAQPYLERALAIRESVLPPSHPLLAEILNNFGGVLRDQGDYAGAQPYLERALAIRESALPPGHPDIANSLSNLALALLLQGDRDGARQHLERALAIHEAAFGVYDRRTQNTQAGLEALSDS